MDCKERMGKRCRFGWRHTPGSTKEGRCGHCGVREGKGEGERSIDDSSSSPSLPACRRLRYR